MLNYILRRLLLVIPTLIGIMVVNFALVQFVPGGPVEQMIARLEGGGDVFGGFAGAANDGGAETVGQAESQYAGGRGLPPEFIEELEREVAELRREVGRSPSRREENRMVGRS